MRKLKWIVPSVVMSLLLAGCTSSDTETNTTADIRIVDTLSVNADLAYMAASFEELCDDAAIIAEIRIDKTQAELVGDTDMLRTNSDFTVLSLYKGEFEEAKLSTNGGIMRLSEYAEDLTWLDFSKYTDDEMKNGYIEIRLCNAYIPKEGDVLLVFCDSLTSDGMYHPISVLQGVYTVEGEQIVNEAFLRSDNWTDPVAAELKECCYASVTEREYSMTVSCSHEAFVNAIKAE